MRSKTIVVSCNAEKISPTLILKVKKIASKMNETPIVAAKILVCRMVENHCKC